MTGNRLSEIARAMKNADFYPHPAPRIERRETHISLVFLAGAFVYKIKKPVALAFLDFSTLEKRRRACEAEIQLNRRLSTNVYDRVVPIAKSGGGLLLDGPGQPVEYAVRMQRLDDRHTMVRLLGENALDSSDFRQLAEKLAAFYRDAQISRRIGGLETVRENCEENFRQMAPFVGRLISPPRFTLIQTATDGFLQRRQSLFQERVKAGFVREGHGDLRSEHIYFTPGGIQIIDCIEFNERMRINDPASDVAFLVMDLDYQGAFGASQDVLESFVTRCGDLRIFSLIDFYLCYRACVRLKVTCFRLSQEGLGEDLRRLLLERVRTFAALACRYAERFIRPTVYVVMGVIAGGKSTVAKALSDALGIRLYSSDRLRKAVFKDRAGPGSGASYGTGIYRPEARARVYGKMLLQAAERLRNHRSVVLDATFSRPKERAEVLRMAEDAGARVAVIECRSPEDMIRRRLASREKKASASDAGLSIWQTFKENYVPPEEVPDSILLKADTTRHVAALIPEILMAFRQKAFAPALEAGAVCHSTNFD